jgi:transposase
VSPRLARKIQRRKRYTEEFKEQALRAVHERGDRTIAQVAESLGIAEYLLHSWKGREAIRPEPSDRGETAEQELARLRRENADLRKDRDALVKSIAVFVRDRK